MLHLRRDIDKGVSRNLPRFLRVTRYIAHTGFPKDAMQNEREASAVIVFPSEQDQLTWVETQRVSLHRATRLSEN